MATIKGKWRYNDGVISREDVQSAARFTCSAGKVFQIDVYSAEASDVPVLQYWIAGDTQYFVVNVLNIDGTMKDEYKDVDYGTDGGTVSDTFYAWFTANATEQTDPEEPTEPEPEEPEPEEPAEPTDGYISEIEVDDVLYPIVGTDVSLTKVVEQIACPKKNLYDKDKRTDDCSIDKNGNIVHVDGYSISDYIAVEDGNRYTFSRDGVAESGYISSMWFFDETKKFLFFIHPLPSTTISIPSGVYYVRLVAVTERMNGTDGNLQFEKGAQATPYEPYKLALSNQNDVDKLIEDVGDLANGVNDISRAGKNLYNKAKNSVGYALRENTGAMVTDESYSTSEYIEVDANTAYTFSRKGVLAPTWLISNVCFYKSDKTFISYTKSPTTFTTPDETAYLRFETRKDWMEGSDTDGYIQLEKGSSATAYEPYKLVLINQDDVDKLIERTTETYVAHVSAGSFVLKTDGTLLAGASWGSTSYIPVNGGESIRFRGFHCSGNASVCAYKSDFTFKNAIITDESDTGSGKVILIDEDVAYIRASTTNTGIIVVEYIDKPIAETIVENAPYDTEALVGGTFDKFISKNNGEQLGGTSQYGATDFIEVTSKSVKIENPGLEGNAGICEYDENQTFISCLLKDTMVGQYVVPLSINAKYIRASVRKNGWLRIYPVSSEDENSVVSDVVTNWYSATGGQIATPHKKINALKPTITFIDDDTVNYAAVQRYHDIFSAMGVKACYAVVTDYLSEARDPSGELKNLLLRYEEEGFGMLYHAKWQDLYYMEGTNRDIVAAESDYCKGIRKMREIGFIDYNYWVSPYGVMDAEIVSMCKRHGATCLMSTYNNTFIQNNGMNGNGEVVDRYGLPRCSFGNDSAQYPSFTLDALKAEITKCKETNGWIIVTSHAAQWGDMYDSTQTPDQALASVIQHALDNGFEVKTFAEAYAERNGILLTNDIC